MASDRTFTQEELDSIISERLERQKNKFAEDNPPPNLDEDPDIIASREALAISTQKLEDALAEGRVADIHLAAAWARIFDETRIEKITALVPADAEDIPAAVQQVISDIPELKGGAGAPAESETARRIRQRAQSI